jgi:anion-transporting  ArsA/GET3 family ATPase
VIQGNRFLEARARLQNRYLFEIEEHFSNLITSRLPLLDRDVSEVDTLRAVGEMIYGN